MNGGGQFDFVTLLLVLGFSVGVVAVFHRIRLPSSVGFVAVGVLVGPHALALVRDPEQIATLAQVGVILLLFSIGLEFSLTRLRRTWRLLLEAGTPFSLLTIAAGVAVARAIGFDWNAAFFAAFWLALSSTAVVLKALSDRGEVDTPHGRLILAVQLFQDLSLVPMMLILPILGGEDIAIGRGVAGALFQAFAILLAVLAISRWVVPPFLAWVVRSRNRELFLLLVLLLCLGTAGASTMMGLSAALGAFLGGILLSKSEYGLQALSDILPFRDVFTGVFLISVGMLLNLNTLATAPGLVALVVAGVIVIKAVIMLGITLALGYTIRIAALAGAALSQLGEFSFVLAEAGRQYGILSELWFQLLLSATVLTMALTPPLMAVTPLLIDRMSRLAPRSIVPLNLARRKETEPEAPGAMRDHVVIAGYGLNGRNLARLLTAEAIPHCVVELNPRSVRRARAAGERVVYGDITSEHIATHLGLERARALVLTISDPQAARRAIQRIRQLHPELYILARTRYISEVDELYALGANDVVPEEFETSIEIGARALSRFGTPLEKIREHLESIRADRYRAFRPLHLHPSVPAPIAPLFGGVETESVTVGSESAIAGLSLLELALRPRTGSSVLAVVRGEETLTNPPASFVLHEGDILILMGSEEQLDAAREYLASEIIRERADEEDWPVSPG